MAITKATASSVAPAAAGDLVYGSSTNDAAVLALGTAGQVLTVNSGATAPEWATPAGGGKNFTLLNSGNTTLTGSTFTVSGISGVDDLHVRISVSSSANASSQLWVRFNSDTGNNYIRQGIGLLKTTTYGTSTIDQTGGAANVLPLATMGNSAADTFQGGFQMTGCSTAGQKVGTFFGMGTGGGGAAEGLFGIFRFDNSSPISSVSIISSSGNFDLGTVEIYGA